MNGDFQYGVTAKLKVTLNENAQDSSEGLLSGQGVTPRVARIVNAGARHFENSAGLCSRNAPLPYQP